MKSGIESVGSLWRAEVEVVAKLGIEGFDFLDREETAAIEMAVTGGYGSVRVHPVFSEEESAWTTAALCRKRSLSKLRKGSLI
jgi:hypothetical protein